MFDRLVSIDWSGAGRDRERCGLRVAQWSAADGTTLVPPPSKPNVRSWSRDEALAFLTASLQPDAPRTAVAFDFAFGLPWGSDREVFGVSGWCAMLRAIRELYECHGTARTTANAINELEAGHCSGPYRFNESRADFRFYIRHRVPYYRVVELFMPQAISVWYVGSGATVGFHTITGLVCLAKLLELRDKGDVDFAVWPHDGIEPRSSRHVLAEGYPAALPRLDAYGPCRDPHERDAWRMLEWMNAANLEGELQNRLKFPVDAVAEVASNPLERIQFEGWILGVS